MNTQEIAHDLVALCKSGKFGESGEKYWAEDVVSVEPGGPGGMDPVSRGKAGARAKGGVVGKSPRGPQGRRRRAVCKRRPVRRALHDGRHQPGVRPTTAYGRTGPLH